MFADLGEVPQGLMVRVGAEGGAPQVAAKVLDGPYDGTSFKVERYIPLPF